MAFECQLQFACSLLSLLCELRQSCIQGLKADRASKADTALRPATLQSLLSVEDLLQFKDVLRACSINACCVWLISIMER